MIVQAELRRKQSEYEGEPCAVDIGSPESWDVSEDSMSGSGKYCPAAKAMSSSPTTTAPLSESSIRIGTSYPSSAAIRSLRKRARPSANSSSPTSIRVPT